MMKIAIDFGQTTTHVTELIKGKPNVTTNSRKKSYTPTVVSVVDKLPSAGDEILKSQVKQEHIVSKMKGIIARLHDETLLENYCKYWRICMEFRGETRRVPRFFLVEKKDEGFTVEEIVALLFAYVTQGLKKIDGAVMTVPSSFDMLQRQMIRNAAAIAGIRTLGVVEETKAAAKAFVMSENVNRSLKTLLVFQMGGGSIDIAIFEVNKTEVKLLGNVASSHLGGDDFDKNILDYVMRQKVELALPNKGKEPENGEGRGAELSLLKNRLGNSQKVEENSNMLINVSTSEDKEEECDHQRGNNDNKNEVQTAQQEVDDSQVKDNITVTDYTEWAELKEACEKAKRDLGLSNDVRIATDESYFSLTKKDFEKINMALLKQIDCMIDMTMEVTGKEKEEIDAYILVGSSTSMPSVTKIVKGKLGDKQMHLVNPDDAAVIGAAHYANKLEIPWWQWTGSIDVDSILGNDTLGVLLIKGGEIVSAYPHSCVQEKGEDTENSEMFGRVFRR